MKNCIKFIAFLTAVCILQNSHAQVVIFTEGFETNGEGTRYTSNTFSFCSGSPGNNPDYFLRTNTNPVLPAGCTIGFNDALTNLQGSFFWASEDIRSSSPVPNANPPGQLTTQLITITGYVSLNVSLFLATSANNNIRWETSDSINIQASINGGPFNTVGRFMGDGVTGGRLRIDGNLDGVITAADPVTTCDQLNFTRYTFSIPGTGSNLRIRLDFDQVGGTEELGIDQLQVTGISVLPVKLIYFNAAPLTNSTAILRWKVDAASDAAYFEVEKSTNGNDFSVLKNIPATGAESYTAADDNLPELCYYRLRMTDSHGAVTYSTVIKLKRKTFANEINAVFPNPVQDQARVVILSPGSSHGKISICNLEGKILILQPVYIPAGQTVLSVNTEKLPAGFYILKLEDMNGSVLSSVKLIRQ